jgi:hypothetical protein
MATIYQILTKVVPIEVKKVNEDDPLWIFKDDEIDEVEINFSPY